jgi:hypothetical protein
LRNGIFLIRKGGDSVVATPESRAEYARIDLRQDTIFFLLSETGLQISSSRQKYF